MHCRLLQFDARPEQREDFRRLSRQHAEEYLREEPGTLQFHFVQDQTDENRFYAMEGYADADALQAHLHGPGLLRNGPRLGALLTAPPVLLGRITMFSPADTPRGRCATPPRRGSSR